MGAHEGGAGFRGGPGAGERSGQALRGGRIFGDARESAHEAFPRGSEGHGTTERAKCGQVTDDQEVAFRTLAESETRIDRDRIRSDSGGDGLRDGLRELPGDLAEQMSVARVPLHRSGIYAAHVHHDRGRPRPCDRLRHPFVEAEARDVVDQVRAGVERAPCDAGAPCVDRNGPVAAAADPFDDRQNAVDLLRLRDLLGMAVGARAGRFASHVHDRGALIEERERPLPARPVSK